MNYQTPVIVDYGSIVDHTFSRCGGTCGDGKEGNPEQIARDKFCECSHTNLPDQCTCGSTCCA